MRRKADLSAAVIKTLTYSDLFDYPLTLPEIWQRLVKSSPVSSPRSKGTRLSATEVKVGKKTLAQAVDALKAQGLVENQGKFYFLKGRKKICGSRSSRQKISSQKYHQFIKQASWMEKIPSLRLLALTGALAVANAHDHDDFDLLVITQKNRLWLTRFILVCLSELLGRRRRPREKSPQNKLCFNLFLDTSALEMPQKKRSLYTAYEMIQLKPVFDKDNLYHRFLLANQPWAKNYLTNFPHPTDKSQSSQAHQGKLNSWFRLFLDGLEKLFFSLQWRYMKPRVSLETITPHAAFFHPRPTGPVILRQLDRQLKTGLNPLKEV